MISIQGGEWKGRKLRALEREGLRPTSSRVKSSLFNILESIVWKRSGAPDFSAWRCVDLFAGIGGLGLEMLSRGALHCVFVERERAHAKVLQQNIHSLGGGERSEVLVGDVLDYRWEGSGPFDLVLLDPPYADSHLTDLLERLGKGAVLVPGGLVLFEHDPKVRWESVPGLRLQSTRVIGPAGITVYEKVS